MKNKKKLQKFKIHFYVEVDVLESGADLGKLLQENASYLISCVEAQYYLGNTELDIHLGTLSDE